MDLIKRKRIALESALPEKQDSSSDDRAVNEAKAIASDKYDEIEKTRRQAETQTIRESNRDLRVNRKLRWKYARWVFCYLVCYSVSVLVILIASGFNIFTFSLPDTVLEFLVGSTAAAAIGLVLAVTTGLFGKSK